MLLTKLEISAEVFWVWKPFFGNPLISYGAFQFNMLSVILGFIAFLVLSMGNYKVLEKVLVFLVILMSVSFLLTAIITKPNVLDTIIYFYTRHWSKKNGMIKVI